MQASGATATFHVEAHADSLVSCVEIAVFLMRKSVVGWMKAQACFRGSFEVDDSMSIF